MNFRTIASSSNGNAYVLESYDRRPLLIDAGVPLKTIQVATNYTVSGLAGCLISHSHGDHVKAVPQLLAMGVNCYASKETWQALEAKTVNGRHRCKLLEADESIVIHGWRVTPFKAIHDVPGTLGFVVSDLHRSHLMYLTDSAYSPYRFEGLTHIAIECNFDKEILRRNAMSGSVHSDRYKRTVSTHMSLDRVLDFLKASDLKRVQEIHLLHLSDANSDEKAFKSAIEAATGIPCLVARKDVRG